ncbi:MAG: hypothetical protein B6U89_00740 [Desulfurococcales archaeon ex4484_58]|nr:MAG: hypothetical protein B6U89_00740 [Desulfurococcales archaeon ex4484_58]
MSEEKTETGVVENELSTGLVIAGAYADKLRRTLFAQLRDYVKRDKEFAREVARASGEINRLLYIILVENLKCDKGDVVRIRAKYRLDPRDMRIKWDYDTLRVEYFKRHPDEEVNNIVRKVLKEKLDEVLEQYRIAPSREEAEKMLRGETKEEWGEEKTLEVMSATQPLERIDEIISSIGSADPIGETSSGGVVFKLVSREGENIGIAALEPRGDSLIIDSVIIYKGKAYRIYGKAEKTRQEYVEKPELLINELNKYKPTPISEEDAKSIIQGKMEEIV